ncbi:MAG TPA: diadenylate cyclase CdaA [Candidatus Eremiobacteraceae bacterium]
MTLPHIAPSWSDLVDIALTSYIVYIVLLLIRGTRAVQILQGIALLVVLRQLVEYFHLWTMFSILNGLLIAIGVAIPVVFQPELRRALAQIGRTGFLEPHAAHHDAEAIAELCSALSSTAVLLSRAAIGALVVVERNTGLEEYAESGTALDAHISAELLVALFMPRTPLHDGAVIVRRDRILAAGCFLPLSENVDSADRRRGTRHRAAIGITEQTDAVALVVSEETGAIAVAQDGKLTDHFGSADAINHALKSIFTRPSPVRPAGWIDAVRNLWSRSAKNNARID